MNVVGKPEAVVFPHLSDNYFTHFLEETLFLSCSTAAHHMYTLTQKT